MFGDEAFARFPTGTDGAMAVLAFDES